MNIARTLLFISMLVVAHLSHGEAIRDFYAEPGLHPFKDPLQGQTEAIDPFSGMLRLQSTDLYIPGNGGLDISVSRSYVNPQFNVGWYDGVTGIGWTMHFGRIVTPSKFVLCGLQDANGTTIDNPSIEHQDGSRELLVVAKDGSGALVTKSNWRATCLSDGSGYKVTAPNGTAYIMDRAATFDSEISLFVSKIVDIHGNSLLITYQSKNGLLYTSKIEGYTRDGSAGSSAVADGRVVDFAYVDDPAGCLRLQSVSSKGVMVNYTLQQAPEYYANTCKYQLTRVDYPEGLSWSYQYDGLADQAGSHSLRAMVNPYGGRTEYTYQAVQFNDWPDLTQTSTIKTKSISGPGVTPATWSYTFAPHSYPVTGNNGIVGYADFTTIVEPYGKTEYVHQGYSTGGYQTQWAVGLLISKRVYDKNDYLLEFDAFLWDQRLISDEDYYHGRSSADIDTETYAPILMQKQVWRENATHKTLYTNYDTFGNPGTVEETTVIVGESSRITHYSYLNDTSSWIIGKVASEHLVGVGVINRIFSAVTRDLLAEDRFGVPTSYTYTPEGNVATVTNANGGVTTFSNYYRGIPQREVHPEGKIITRTVTEAGTIASVTNGRSFTTSYLYDDLNRLISVTKPINNPVSVVWRPYTGPNAERTVTRGNLIQTLKYDGFGRPVIQRFKDASTGYVITKTYTYDALGRIVFESNPNSAQGLSYEYDNLGRKTKVVNEDNTEKRYIYGIGGVLFTSIDERGSQSVSIYRAYGNPDNSPVLIELTTPENVCTYSYYNVANLITLVHQGQITADGACFGYSRTYSYNSQLYLVGDSNTERQNVTYERDMLGNVIARKVGIVSNVSYQYDGLQRLTGVIYSDGTSAVNYSYDADNHVIGIDNGVSLLTYSYDANDNLTNKTQHIDGYDYHVSYGYDGNDVQSSMTYPSGRTVSYSPDAFGRSTSALPYLTSISYHPSGQVASMTYANGVTTTMTLQERLWVNNIKTIGIDTIVDLAYIYDSQGNVSSISDSVTPSANRAMSYDEANRLITASGAWGSKSYTYDANGNITHQLFNGVTTTYVYTCMKLTSYSSDDVTNLYTSNVAHDIRGNVQYISNHKQINNTVEEYNYEFNDADQMVLAVHRDTAAGYHYTMSNTYNGASELVKRMGESSDPTYFVHKGTGYLLGEYKGDPSTGREYFYLGSQLIANAQINKLPTAGAGDDQTVSLGKSVTLDGSGSLDPDGSIVSYNWSQLSGASVTLSSATTAIATFTAPQVSSLTTLTFRLTVTDDTGDASSDTVSITINPNTPPVAVAGPDQSMLSGTAITLNGSGSYDAESALTYYWSHAGGPLVNISNNTTDAPTVSARTLGYDYTIQIALTVTDAQGLYSTDTLNITVSDATKDLDGDSLPDWWEIKHFGDIAQYGATSDPDGDGLSNLQEYQENTNPGVAEPPPAQVSGFVAMPGESENTLSWYAGKSVSSYNLYWSTTPNVMTSTATKIANVTSPYVHKGVVNGTPYYYVVTAVNGSGESVISTVRRAQPGARAWQPPVKLSSYAISPEIATNIRGDIIVVWVEEVNRQSIRAMRFTENDGWKGPVNLNTAANYIGDPHVSIDETGNALVVWQQSDGVRLNLVSNYYSSLHGEWSGEQLVEYNNGNLYSSGSVNAVSNVVMSDNGVAAVAWTQEGAYFYPASGRGLVLNKVHVNRYDMDNRQWMESILLDSTDVSDSEEVKIAITPDGKNIAAVWRHRTDVDGPDIYGLWDTNILASYKNNLNWSPATVIDTHSDIFDVGDFPDISIDATGNATAIWRQLANSKLSVWTNRFNAVTQAWSGATSTPGAAWSKPLIATNGAGYTGAIGGTPLEISYTPQGALSWSRAKSVPDAIGNYLYDITLDDFGNTMVYWTSYDPLNANISQLYAARNVSGTGWGTKVLLNPASTGQISTSSLSQAPRGNSVIAYSQFQNGNTGAQDLWISRYTVTPPVNQPPHALAGSDQVAEAYATVTLDGSSSYDPEGDQLTYRWAQVSGSQVMLSDLTTPSTTFTAPGVTSNENLTFSLTVTDGSGQTASDEVQVTVVPPGGSADIVPPVTTGAFTRTTAKGIAYFNISLSTNEPATTLFRLTGGAQVVSGGAATTAWQTYRGAIQVKLDKGGTAQFDYYSTDLAGNVEATKTEVLQ